MLKTNQFLQCPDRSSYNVRIASGFLLVIFFVFIGKIFSAAKEMATAYRYGVSETVDAYVYLFSLITWPSSVWFGVVSIVFVPLTANVRHVQPEELRLFQRELTGITIVAAGFLGGLFYFGLPLLLKTQWTGLSGIALERANTLAGPLTLLLPIGLLSNLFSAWLMACGRHLNTLLEALPGLGVLAALLLLWGWAPEPLAWGSIAGFSLQLLGLVWSLRRADELRWPALGFQSLIWKDFLRHAGIMTIGQALATLTMLVDQFFAARLGLGAISSLSYANRVISLILSLVATSINRAALPIFSEIAAKGDTAQIKGIVTRWAKLMLLAGAGSAAAAWWAMPLMVRILFQRGEFSAANSAEVTLIAQYFLLQVPVYFYAIVLSTALSSVSKYHLLLLTSTVAFIVKPLSASVFISHVGINGIPLSALAAHLAVACCLTIAMMRATRQTCQ